jgi:hypothetical protein
LYGPRVKQLCKPPLPADSNRKKQTENTNWKQRYWKIPEKKLKYILIIN